VAALFRQDPKSSQPLLVVLKSLMTRRGVTHVLPKKKRPTDKDD